MIDQLKIFRGHDYEINSHIVIRQPTLGEICDYGEQRYFGNVRLICSTPADQKVKIWDALHIFWDQMDEFELFQSMVLGLKDEDLSILFGDLDFTSFTPAVRPDINEPLLVNKDKVQLDRITHKLIVDCLRQIHCLRKNTDVGYDEYTKEIMIEDDRDDMMAAMRKPYESALQPLISSLTNSPEFKYRHDDVWDMPIGAFMDSVRRIQKVKNHNFVMHGVYNGCVDMKKISKKELDWMGEL